MAEHRAVQILTQDDSGKYVLNEEELEKVLTQPEVAENPVALYSVSGPFRKGKSFMLNLFLQYMWNGRDIKWKKDPEKLVDKGFSWRGGRDRNTHGILIWTEPFLVDIDGKEVAILLMDTQGTFDMNTSMQGNSLVFALSTLISSMQIYNLSQQVSQSDLQALQLFTEFGKLAQAENNDIRAFQSLFFLIRDWSDEDEKYGLESGKTVLDEILCSKNEKEIENILTSIQKSFEKKECFLMPEPNKSIRKRGKEKGPCKLKEIGEEFLDEVQVLMDHIFSDSNIPIKKVNGKEVTGIDLLNYSISYMNQLTKDDVPQVKTLFQASTDTYWLNAVRQCQKKYKKWMETVLGENHISDDDLNKQHNKIKKDVIELFQNRRKMGEETTANVFKSKLEKKLKKDFTLFLNVNLNNKKSHMLKCNKVIADSRVELQSLLEEKSSEVDFLEDETLAEIFKEFKKSKSVECLNIFSCGTTDKNFVRTLEGMLSNSWNKIYNNHNIHNKRSKEKYQTRLERQAGLAKRVYEEEVNFKTKGGFVEKEELDKISEGAKKSSFSAFDSFFTSAESRPQIAMDIRKQLQKDILVKQTTSYENNERYRSNRPYQAVDAAKNKYIEEMNLGLGNPTEKIQDLEKCHENSLAKARPIMRRMLSSCDDNTQLKCKEELEQTTTRIFQSFKRRTLASQELNLETYKTEALKQYKDQMKKLLGENMSTDDVKSNHNNCMTQAKEFFRKEMLEMGGSPDKYLDDLEEAISYEFSEIFQAIEDERKEIVEAAIQEAVTTYIKYMKQFTEGKYILPEVLSGTHEKLKVHIRKNWCLSVGCEPPDELNTALEKAFYEVEEENKENQELWVRTQSSQAQEAKSSDGMFAKFKKYLKRRSTDTNITRL